RVEHDSRCLERTDVKGYHTAKTVLLSSREGMLRMRRRARIVNPLHLRMLFQKRRHRATGFIVLLHAQRECFCAAEDKPGVERRKDRSRTVLYETDPIRVFFVVQYHDAADAVRMAIQVLGCRVDHDVNT